MTYVIEYKSARHPYGYRFLMKANGQEFQPFDSIVKARKKCIDLIKDHTAILAVVRGGVEQLVYQTRNGNFVVEDRSKDKWNYLNKDGTCGSQIKNIKNVDLIRSAW